MKQLLRQKLKVALSLGLGLSLATTTIADDPVRGTGSPFDQPATNLTLVQEGSPSDAQPTVAAIGSPKSEKDAAASDAAKNLSEDDVKKIVDKYIKDKAAADEAKLTPKEKKDKELQMSAKWNDGLELSTKDKHFKTHIGGRVQFDTAWFKPPRNVQQNINQPYGDGVDFRRARMRIDGVLYEVHEYACEFDFVNSARVRAQPAGAGGVTFFEETLTAPTDLWYQINEIPIIGHVRIGNQKEQVGFEHIVSSRFQPFMERSFNQDAFYGGLFNGFQPGITFQNTYAEQSGVWNMGIFKPTNNVFSSSTGDGDYAVSGRLTKLLAWENEGEQLFHVGISGRQGTAVSQSGVSGRVITYRTRDAVRSGLSNAWPVPAGINLFGEGTQTANAEVVAVNGPWTWQSEYLINALNDARLNFADQGRYVQYHGGYMQLMYFLTGEHDNYDRKNGAFGRVKPRNNFFTPSKCHGCRGSGAWQIGFRYNYLDLNDKGLNGGILNSYVLGLNWFWNPNMKWQFNYSATDRDSSAVPGRELGSGTIHGFGTRIALDF